MKMYLKVLVGCQIAIGLLLIFIPLYTLSNIGIVTERPAQLSMIIGALQGASPTPEQIQRAAKILTIQSDSLAVLGSAAIDASRGLEYSGGFFVFSGVVLLIAGRKKYYGTAGNPPEISGS
jgi:hypothetical protein